MFQRGVASAVWLRMVLEASSRSVDLSDKTLDSILVGDAFDHMFLLLSGPWEAPLCSAVLDLALATNHEYLTQKNPLAGEN